MAFNPNKCLKFTFVGTGSGSLSCTGYQFSKDGGATWANNGITAFPGDNVYMKGNHYPGSTHMQMSGQWKTVSGSIMSLIDDGAGELLEITVDSAFDSFFSNCIGLVGLHTGLLPAMTLTRSCYGGMFGGCTGLTELPDNFLPATVAAYGCYKYMFQNCTNIIKTGKNFTKIEVYADYVFNGMFYGCSSLQEISENFFTEATPVGNNTIYYFCVYCPNLKTVYFNFKEWGAFDQEWHDTGVRNGVCYAPRELPEQHGSWNYLPYGWTMQPLTTHAKGISVIPCGHAPRPGRKM